MMQFGPTFNGSIIGGRYQVESLLGRGGMSSVYKAFDPNLQRTVAVKIIHPHLTDNPEFIKRFEQEAAAVAQLRHSHIVQVHDFNNDDGIYYMVLEFVPGETLAKKLTELTKAGLRLPLTDVTRILAIICDAVDYAHQRRMIHRDLKPANIMINLLGEPILMDFGIAKIVGGDINTGSGAAVGTAAYMSPEQVQGKPADHRSDIYSLGITLYETLSGQPPFLGDSTYQIMLKHINEPVPDIRLIDANTPNALVTVLEKALTKNPDQRFQTAAEMATALRTAGLQLQGPLNLLAARHLDHLATLWQEAYDLLDERDFAGCIDRLDELKRADPDYQPEKVNQLRQEVTIRLYERAVRLFQVGKFNDSLSLLKHLYKRAPSYPGLEQLETQIRNGIRGQILRAQLDRLYDEAVAYLDQHNYEQVLEKWADIRRQQGTFNYPDRFQIEKRAKEGICTQFYTQAVTALVQGDTRQAIQLWEQIQATDPNYPDMQEIAGRAQASLRQREKKRVWTIRLGGLAAVLLLFMVTAFFITRETDAPVVLAEVMTESPLPLATGIENTATHTPTPTIPATATPTLTPTATAEPTATPSPEATASATKLPTPTPEYLATALQPSTIFAAPDVAAPELAIVRVGDQLSIWGRSTNGTWLYVQNDENIAGFVFASRLQWQGDIEALLVVEPGATGTRNPTAGQ